MRVNGTLRSYSLRAVGKVTLFLCRFILVANVLTRILLHELTTLDSLQKQITSLD